MPHDQPHHNAIPESLRRQLLQFRRQLWRAKIAEAILAGLFGLLLSYLFVFALDRVWQTPPLARLCILLAGSSLMAIFAPLWMHRWVWKHRRENQLARLIAKKHPGLGDRLLGVIELQDDDTQLDGLSPQLRDAAMKAVAAEATRRHLDTSLPNTKYRNWLVATVTVLLLATASLIMVPQAGLNSFKRWLFPLSDTERYTFTKLNSLPESIPVPIGEAFSLNLQLSANTEWHPEIATARIAKQDPITAPRNNSSYHFDFPGQQNPATLRLSIGDARHAIKIIPSKRPIIKDTYARIEYPEYLQLNDAQTSLNTGSITAVKGSRVRFSVNASSPLKTAFYGPVTSLTSDQSSDPSKPESENDASSPSPDDSAPTQASPMPMEIRNRRAESEWIQVNDHALQVPIQWSDHLGLEGTKGYALTIDSINDEAPSCYLEGTPAQQAILAGETIEFDVTARDDFGLREVGLVWEGESTRSTTGQPANGELLLERGAPDLPQISVSAAFSPQTLELEPQKLILRAYVEDYLPGRERSYSQPITIYILSPEEHAQMLKNQFDRAIRDLEDIARQERNLLEENQRLERLDGEALRKDEAAQRLKKQQQAEAEQAQKMQELAEQMEKLLQDSARNESIDDDTMRKMLESMEAMREMAQQDIPQVESKLNQAGDQRNTDEKSEQEMDQAVEQQEELLKKMQETVEKANEAQQQFEASTFAARLKKAASNQENIKSAILKLNQSFGEWKEDLDPSITGKINDIIRKQSANSSDIRWIQEDLGHFFTRTDKAIFGEIMQLMAESNIDMGLEDVRMKLGQNHSWKALEAANMWAAKLQEWASMLEDSGDAGGGGGGGGGGDSQQDEDFEFMLRVMRMVQQEQDIRARTRALETLRRSLNEE